MEPDIYDVIQKRDQEVEKLKGQIARGEATEEECYLVQIAFQQDIDRILTKNARFDY